MWIYAIKTFNPFTEHIANFISNKLHDPAYVNKQCSDNDTPVQINSK